MTLLTGSKLSTAKCQMWSTDLAVKTVNGLYSLFKH